MQTENLILVKKVAYIALISLLLTQSGGLFFVFKIRQLAHWQEMMHELFERIDGFEKLTLSIEEFEQCKINSHEIFYKGEMYDFKSAVYASSTVELLAIKDSREKEIIKKIKQIAQDCNNQKQHVPLQLLSQFTITFIKLNAFCDFANRKSEKHLFLPFIENPQTGFLQIAAPPPERNPGFL